MKKMTAFYILGSVGFVITALLHILVASLTGSGNLLLWTPLYLTWLVFMVIGVAQIKRRHAQSANEGAVSGDA